MSSPNPSAGDGHVPGEAHDPFRMEEVDNPAPEVVAIWGIEPSPYTRLDTWDSQDTGSG